MTDKFNTKITQALDRSLDDLNRETLEALAAAREKAMTQASATGSQSSKTNVFDLANRRRKYYVPALAAALLLAVVIPNLDQYSATKAPTANLENYYDVDPEMLETADILLLLGELTEEEAGG